MSGLDLLGYVAGALTTAAFVPQLVKTWRSRSAGDLSYGMMAVFSTGVALWLAYGIVLESWPVILANAVTLVLSLAILALRIRFERR